MQPRRVLLVLCWLLLDSAVVLAAPKPPTVQVTTPTTQATYTTTAPSLLVAGTARAAGGVRQVAWQTEQGGSGLAQGTTSWSVLLSLALGVTSLTVTTTDRAGRRGADVLTITRVDVPPPLPPPPAPPRLAWGYEESAAGDAFQMERCAGPAGCTMTPVAAIGISERQWTDTSAVLGAPYCWRLAATLGEVVGPYSNTACTP